MSKTVHMFDELPKYTRNDRMAELGIQVNDSPSDFAVRFNDLMNHFKLEAADIVRDCPSATFSTVCGWMNGSVDIPVANQVTKEVLMLFGITADFFLYGVPISERDIEVDKGINEAKQKRIASA